MPFTLAHPAAVVFLARGPLILLALVSGSVAPDVPYFLRVTPLRVTAESWYEPYVNATASHSLGQLFPVTVPLALTVYLFACFLLPPLRSVAGIEPSGSPARNFSSTVRHAVWIIVSLVIGILTHLLWDALTELGGDWSRVLQHGSSALGLTVLAIVAFQQRKIIPWQDAAVRRRLTALGFLTGSIALISAVVASWSWFERSSGFNTSEIIEGVLTTAAKGSGGGLVVATAVLALSWWLARGIKTARGR